MKKYAAIFVVLAFVLAGFVGFASAADERPVVPNNVENPIVVNDPSEVPEGAVEDAVSTYNTPGKCDTTRSWVLTVPASEDTTHEEYRYKKVVPPQTHEEYRYERTVKEYKTEYHFAKYTQTKSRTYVEGQAHIDHWWNWSPNDTSGPQNYVPNFPNDPRGTWQGPHVNGGPSQGTYGTFQTGGGNSPYFHREHIQDFVAGGWGPWSAFGPWTPWVPQSHVSWQDNTDPLGSPAFHGQWTEGNTQYYRQWQARYTGNTRQTETGSHVETSDWLRSQPAGEGWVQIDQRTVTDVGERTLYYVLGGEPSENEADATWLLAEQAPGEPWVLFDTREVSNEDGTPEIVTYYAWTDDKVCEDNPPPNNPPEDNPPGIIPPVTEKPDNPRRFGVPTLVDSGL